MTEPASAEPPGSLIPAPPDGLSLEFANTRFWRGSDPATETLNRPADLLAWAAANGLDRELVERLEREWADRPVAAATAFDEAIRWREAIHAVFSALAAGTEPSPRGLADLNRVLAHAPVRHRLARTDGRFVWEASAATGIAMLLAPVLWSAGDLLTGPRLGRVRRCANDRCRWLFLDDSKSANRRWCSMSQCGNRAKAHRHYVRRKQT